jgi:DNA invertase Pin-like site-specific DNA recombinase
MATAYSYIRWSNPKQEKGDSLRRQVEYRQEWLAKHPDVSLDDSLVPDKGLSAFKGHHLEKGALGQFLRACQAGQIKAGSYLIVEKLDRLSRQGLNKAVRMFMDIVECGVTVVTLEPLREYTEHSLGDLGAFWEMVMGFYLAHEESKKKSERLSRAWKGKRQNLNNKKLTGRVPAWITLTEDKKVFESRKESVKTVVQIFKWAASGVGVNSITKRLNAAAIHNFGNRSKTGWHRSYVLKILRNRAVLGEFQPHVLQNGKRKPVDEPITDYYPRIIDDSLFYQAQQALASRRCQRGPVGKGVANLFTGLLYDAYDGLPMNLVDKGGRSTGKRLVSSGAIRGVAGSSYRSFSYAAFEEGFLHAMRELKASEFAQDENSTKEHLDEVSGQLAEKEHQLEQAKIHYEKTGSEALLDLVTRLEASKKVLASDLEKMQTESATKGEELFSEAQSLVETLNAAVGDERERLREKIKGKIRLLISEIWMMVHGKAGKATAEVQIFFRNGKAKVMLVGETPFATGRIQGTVDLPDGRQMPDGTVLRLDLIAQSVPRDLDPALDLRMKHKQGKVAGNTFQAGDKVVLSGVVS